MARKILLKCSLLLLVLVMLNWVYRLTFYEEDLREKSAEILDIRNTLHETDIYYFGESSNVTYAESDSVKESISALTARFFPGLRLTNINKYATHAGIYRSWLEAIDAKPGRPAALVVTLNLRSFDAAWIHSKLETQLRESLVMSGPWPAIVNRFLLSLQAFDNKTEQQREQDVLREWRTVELKFPFPFPYKTVAEWDYAMAQGTYLKSDGSWDMEKIALACHFIKGYAFNLSGENPRVKDFDAIAEWCRVNDVRLYLNLMAENVQYADSLVGKELVFLMRQNRDYLVNRYHKGNCRVVDNLESVKGKDFIDQNWTTEHYNYFGRATIAARLADSLRRDFGKWYKQAN
jgi:hypothetical protein